VRFCASKHIKITLFTLGIFVATLGALVFFEARELSSFHP
jgi:hypothetical protein